MKSTKEKATPTSSSFIYQLLILSLQKTGVIIVPLQQQPQLHLLYYQQYLKLVGLISISLTLFAHRLHAKPMNL
jgi:hypothetical protein